MLRLFYSRFNTLEKSWCCGSVIKHGEKNQFYNNNNNKINNKIIDSSKFDLENNSTSSKQCKKILNSSGFLLSIF